MTKITIIGCGWLGLPLGKSLVENGYNVFGTTRSERRVPTIEATGMGSILLDKAGSFTQNSTEKMGLSDFLIITIPPNWSEAPEEYAHKLQSFVTEFPPSTTIIFTSSTGIYPKKSGTYSEDYIFSVQEQKSALFQAEKMLLSLPNRAYILRLGGLFGPQRHPITFLTNNCFIFI